MSYTYFRVKPCHKCDFNLLAAFSVAVIVCLSQAWQTTAPTKHAITYCVHGQTSGLLIGLFVDLSAIYTGSHLVSTGFASTFWAFSFCSADKRMYSQISHPLPLATMSEPFGYADKLTEKHC
jgi:hypothetical protein